MKKRHLKLLFGISLFLTSCAAERSSLVNQAAIYSGYSLFHDESTQSLQAISQFNFGGATGTYLELDKDSEVSFDNDKMNIDPNLIGQVFYRWSKDSLPMNEIWKEHRFTYKNNDGIVYQNTVSLPLLVTSRYSSEKVKLSSSVTIDWLSPNVIGTDSLNLLWVNAEGGVALYQSIGGNLAESTSGTVQINSQELKKIGVGNYSAQLCRTRTKIAQQSPAQGGTITMTSCHKKTSLQLIN